MRPDGSDHSQLDMRRFATELIRAVKDGEAGVNRAKASTPWGSTKTLTTDGTSAIPPSDQTQMLLQVTSPDGVPRAWIVNMAGDINQNSTHPLFTYPFAKFTITWGSAGALESTEVDGFSDQFLMVFGNQITVSCSLDLFNARNSLLFNIAGQSLEFPKNMVLKASLADSEGARTAAKRTFFVPPVGSPGPDTLLPIPYAATGVILRTGLPAVWLDPVTGSQLSFEVNGSLTQELYTAANVSAAHGRGEYLSIPSMADTIRIRQPTTGPPAGPAFCEFLMEP